MQWGLRCIEIMLKSGISLNEAWMKFFNMNFMSSWDCWRITALKTASRWLLMYTLKRRYRHYHLEGRNRSVMTTGSAILFGKDVEKNHPPSTFYKHTHTNIICSSHHHLIIHSILMAFGELKQILVQSAPKVLNSLGWGISHYEGECLCVCVFGGGQWREVSEPWNG